MKINTSDIYSTDELVRRSKSLEGKMLFELCPEIIEYDYHSRVRTKGSAGYAVEYVFGIDINSDSNPDFRRLDIELKTCPLKFVYKGAKLTVKEPLSGNIINYDTEYKNKSLRDSSFYQKNKRVLFVSYIHDDKRKRSQYFIKYAFLWEMNDRVLRELEPDYEKILAKIREGKAHEIHQGQHKYLTLCPKHNGNFKDPNCTKSKRNQPFSDTLAEVRAFRLKNCYMIVYFTE